MVRRLVGAVLVAVSVSVASAYAATGVAHPALSQNPAVAPKKVVLLPPQIFVFELSAGGVPTRMGDWEAAARSHLAAAATQRAQAAGLFQVIPLPALAPADLESLEAHMGLYERVAQSVFVYGRGDQAAWAHKKHEFDYTLGPGLAFLRERTGADAALIVLGTDFISSGGRKAAFIAGLALGVVMPLGQSFVTAGVVDLDSGDIRWMSFDASASTDTRNAADVDGLMRALYQTWPRAR